MQHVSRNREDKELAKKEISRDISRSEFENAIDEWCLNKKYREILKHRFIDGCTYEEIAEIVDMSDRQVKRIVYKYGDAVLRHIPF